MIKQFYNLSLQRKQMVIIMLISTVALLLTCVAFVTYDALAYRRELVEHLSSLADVVGNNTTAAIDFNDPAAASQTLAALRGEDNITIARVHKTDGETFATYARDGVAPSVAPLTGPSAQHEFKDQELHLFRPILQGSEPVGTIELVADLSEFRRRLWRYVGIVAIVFGASLVIAFYLSLRLGRVISKPVHHLAGVVRSVAQEKNYSVRATKQSADELGELIDGFNEMLTQIQQRDGALQAAQETLELRVEKRTQELANSLSLLNATLDSTADGILAVQFSGAVVCHNSQFAAMWKIPAGALAKWSTKERHEFIAGQVKDADRYLEVAASKWANPGTETFNIIELKDGRIFEHYVRPQQINGECVGMVVNCRDITQRKRSEVALHESRALYDSLVEHLPAGVFRKDREGRFVFVNSWYCRLKGVKADYFLGKTPPEVAISEPPTPDGKSPEGMKDAEMAARGANHHLQIMQSGKSIEIEEQYRDADGNVQYLHVVKSPVFGPDGNIMGSQGMLFDITESKRAQAELAYERGLLRTLLDNAPDHIYFKDAQSRFIKSSKAQAAQFGFKSSDELVGKTDFDFFSEEHARPAFEDEQAILRTGQPIIGKIEKESWKDGRGETWVLTTKMPFRNKDGEIVGTFGISKDITAIKQSEAELARAHKEIVETSRQAGMAEVATGVLHNVGNVLNSVNVASSCVADNLRRSKAANLFKVVALLKANEADLGGFFTRDPKGKQLLGYLAQLTEHIASEQADAQKELAELQKHIDHIKDIVSMQQNFAKVSGVTEAVNVTDLVEDALHMNESALIRHDVKIIKEFGDAPPVTVEKHKVLQILINLVTNAKQACDTVDRDEKIMTLRVMNGAGRIRISVTDNGVGIPAENLNRIFNHGFTTKKNGHGFGLHSGALAAKEMGGSLSAHSDGTGTGSTFTLELPLDSDKANNHGKTGGAA